MTVTVDYRPRQPLPGARITSRPQPPLPMRHAKAEPLQVPPSVRETAPQRVVPDEPADTFPPLLKWKLTDDTDPVGAYGGAPAFFRARTLAILAEWGVPRNSSLAESVELVLGELAANALTASASLPDADDGHLPSIIVSLRFDGQRVLVQVWDEAPGDPEPEDADLDAESGRGFMIIDALCESRGCYRTGIHGKFVWAIVSGAV